MLLAVSPGRSIPVTPAAGASRTSRLVAVIHPCTLGLFLVDAVGESAALARGVVGVLVPQALAIEEPVEVLLVEGRPELGPVSDGDGVLRALLVVLALG